MMEHHVDFIIVGGGISGLACARELKNKGYNILVIEAENKIGGRIRTEKINNEIYDLGASWIHGIKNNPIYEIAKKKDINHSL